MMQPRITIPLVAIVAALGMIAGSAVAAPAGNSNKLQCFSDPPATCAISASGIATLDNSAGGDSGVYITGSNLLGKRLSQVGRLSFNYTGTPTNGSPRVTLPLDTNADGLTDDYVSISAFFCNDGAGLVDITNPNCTIFLNSNGTTPAAANWAEFVAAHPSWTIGPDGNLPFIIADDTGSWTVSNVFLGKGTRTSGN